MCHRTHNIEYCKTANCDDWKQRTVDHRCTKGNAHNRTCRGASSNQNRFKSTHWMCPGCQARTYRGPQDYQSQRAAEAEYQSRAWDGYSSTGPYSTSTAYQGGEEYRTGPMQHPSGRPGYPVVSGYGMVSYTGPQDHQSQHGYSQRSYASEAPSRSTHRSSYAEPASQPPFIENMQRRSFTYPESRASSERTYSGQRGSYDQPSWYQVMNEREFWYPPASSGGRR